MPTLDAVQRAADSTLLGGLAVAVVLFAAQASGSGTGVMMYVLAGLTTASVATALTLTVRRGRDSDPARAAQFVADATLAVWFVAWFALDGSKAWLWVTAMQLAKLMLPNRRSGGRILARAVGDESRARVHHLAKADRTRGDAPSVSAWIADTMAQRRSTHLVDFLAAWDAEHSAPSSADDVWAREQLGLPTA